MITPTLNAIYFVKINEQDGTLSFPNGLSLSPTITQHRFLASPDFADADSYDCGTLPYIHYNFSGGYIKDRELLVHACFYDQMLLETDVTACDLPPEKRDWSNYSLDIQRGTKRFHDKLLAEMLGKPSEGGSFLLERIPAIDDTLNKPLTWRYPWGVVISSHDWKGGGTSLGLIYGDRREKAQRAYLRKAGQPK